MSGTNYRIDLVGIDEDRTPVGMNSLVYLDNKPPSLRLWGGLMPRKGQKYIWSVWSNPSSLTGEYRIVRTKGSI